MISFSAGDHEAFHGKDTLELSNFIDRIDMIDTLDTVQISLMDGIDIAVAS